MAPRTPELGALLNAVKRGVARDIHVALPARVESYDPAKQTVDVQPLITEVFNEEDGTVTNYSLPVIPSVPLVFPGAGGFRLTFPLQQGDTVLLIFADRAIDGWQESGRENTPVDERRHALTDAIAIPGLHASTQPWTGADTSVITIGKDGAAADWAALATKVKTEIQSVRDTLNALVTAFNSHVHVTTCPSGPGSAAPTVSPASPPATVNDVASATVKVQG